MDNNLVKNNNLRNFYWALLCASANIFIVFTSFIIGFINIYIFLLAGIGSFITFLIAYKVLNRKDYLTFSLLCIYLISYPIKYFYIYKLYFNPKTQFIFTQIYDLSDSGYLDTNLENHIFFVSVFVSGLTAIFTYVLLFPKIDFTQISFKFKKLKNSFLFKKLVLSKLSLVYFFLLSLFLLFLANIWKVGLSSNILENLNRPAYKLDTIVFYLIRYFLTLYGVFILFFKIYDTNKIFGLVKRLLVYSLFIYLSIYTTSKEFIYATYLITIIDILKIQKLKIYFGFFLKTILISLSTFYMTIILEFTNAVRIMRSRIFCPECTGIEAIEKTFNFYSNYGLKYFLEEQSFSNQNLYISNIDRVLAGTIFRPRGAETLMQIITTTYNSEKGIDLFGFFESIFRLRQEGGEWFGEQILSGAFSRIGVAFSPSFLGISLQYSRSILNPYIFIFSFLVLLFIVSKLAFSSRFSFIVLLGFINIFESLRCWTEGLMTFDLPFLIIFLVLIERYLIPIRRFNS